MMIESFVRDPKQLSSASGQCYEQFKTYLVTRGFTVYPWEFDCWYSKHPFVDIAAKMGSYYWAFEYKSENDSISRGVEQIQCYSEWFDYVVLVTERKMDHRTSNNYWELKTLGAGLWFYDRDQDKCITCSNPSIQNPPIRNKRHVARRFGNVIRKRLDLRGCEIEHQLDLFAFVS